MQATLNLFGTTIDMEYKTRIAAARVTLEFASAKAGTLETFEDSPLFGGGRQTDLFAMPCDCDKLTPKPAPGHHHPDCDLWDDQAGFTESEEAELASLEQRMYDRAHVDPKEYSRWLDSRV